MDRTIRQMLITVLILLAGLFVIRFLFMLFAPFIIALILAKLIDPAVTGLEKKVPGGRTAATLLVLAVLVGVLVLLLVLGVSRLYVEVNQIIRTLPEYEALVEQLQFEGDWRELLESFEVSDTILDAIEDNMQIIFTTVRSGVLEIANHTLNAISRLPMALVILFLSIVATFYLSKDKERIDRMVYKLFPDEWEKRVTRFKKELSESALGYIKAQLILISISGTITGIGLFIMDSEYALSLAVMAAVLDLIPIIGPALIFYPWAIFSVLTGSLSTAAGLIAIHLTLTGVRSAAEGQIIGGNIGIHPLATLMSLFAGFRLLGVVGLLAGPILLVLVKTSARAGLIPFWEAEKN